MNQTSLHMIDFDWILEEAASHAITERARRTIRESMPFNNKRQIEQMLNEVAEAVKILHISASIPIHSLDDMEHYLEHAKKGLFLQPEQLQRTLSFLEHCRKLKKFMKDKETAAPIITSYVHSYRDLDSVEEEISRSLRHGQIDDHATSELANIRRHLRQKQADVKDKAEAMSRSKKLAAFLQENIVVEKKGRYTVPVQKTHRNKVSGTVIDVSASGATVFMEPQEVAAVYEELEYLKMAEEHEVEQILYTLTGFVLEKETEIRMAIDTIHHYDVIFAKAKYGLSIDGIIPQLNEEFEINFNEARHPLLGEAAVPLSIQLGSHEKALVITGPNTGGKTVTLKTVGLLTMMAQTAMMVPSAVGTNIHIFSKLFVDMGDGQSIDENLSTFSSRLTNIIDILEQADDRTLVLLDELGSGTDPNEGMALAQVILEQLFQKGATLLATTHYRELKALPETYSGFINGSMEFDVDTLKPTYKLILGETGNSQAFDIALKLGLHPELVKRAHALTGKEEVPDRLLTEKDGMAARYEKQIAINKYARMKPKQKNTPDSVPTFNQGDNVNVFPEDETGIVYKGPDERGNFIVQIKDEKKKINHTRLKLYIAAKDLYPDDYDFDIVFKSKDYRKKKHQMGKKHVEGLELESEE